jgi:glycosyltransferase involved in cell wall biosynthesis
MGKARRILIVADISLKPAKIFQNQVLSFAKGLIRRGNDARIFNYSGEIAKKSPFKSRTLSKLVFKNKVDRLLCDFCKDYEPDLVCINFPKLLDYESLVQIRAAAPRAKLLGSDGDPWPKAKPERLRTAKGLDIVVATNDDEWLQDYRDAGVGFVSFIPNCCDPDIEHRYEVGDRWRSDILWIGTLQHHADTSYNLRRELVLKLAERKGCAIYGACGRDKIEGKDTLYAISGTKIGLSINAYEPVRLAHSNRLTRLMAGGAFVLSNRFPGCELLYKDGKHLKYFDTIEEFFELAGWYLSHERERKKIADAGMAWVHEQFNCEKIAGYTLELAEHGRYSAPWYSSLSTARPAD